MEHIDSSVLVERLQTHGEADAEVKSRQVA